MKIHTVRTAALLLASLFVSELQAQRLLRDLNVTHPDLPYRFTAAGSQWFFVAQTVEHGAEPWVTDGTVVGTRLIADLVPGPRGSDPSRLVAIGARVIFATPADALVWASDGTAAGTIPLATGIQVPWDGDVDMAAGSTGPIWFSGADGRPWITDGTVTGTRPATNPWPLSGTARRGFTAFGVGVWFVGLDPSVGRYALYRGSPQGTVTQVELLSSREPYITAANDSYLYVQVPMASSSSVLFLYAPDGTRTQMPPELVGNFQLAVGSQSLHTVRSGSSWDLYAFDPASGLTRLSRGISSTVRGATRLGAGPAALFLAQLLPAEEWAVFRTDGTTSGTTRLATLPVTGSPQTPIVVNGNRGHVVVVEFGRETLVSFGIDTPGPAVADPRFVRVHEIAATPRGELISAEPVAGVPGIYLDAAGALSRLRALNVPTGDSRPRHFLRVGDRAYFSAEGGATSRCVLWSTNGSANDLHCLDVPWITATPAALGHLALLPTGEGTFASDGTAAGTTLLLPNWEGRILAARTWALMSQYPAGGGPLAYTDGTPMGTHSLPGLEGIPMAALGDRIVFWANDPAHGNEPWVSAGSATSTALLRDILPGPDGQVPCQIIQNADVAATAHLVFFAASDGIHGREPWCSDGTPAGTRMLADLEPGPGSSFPRGFVRVGSRVAFFIDTSGNGYECNDVNSELWITDGNSTTPLATQRSNVLWTTAIGERLFVSDQDSVHCIWTDSNPVRIETVLQSNIQNLFALGDRAVLSEFTSSGNRTWISDGSAAGTYPWSDLELTGGTRSVALLAPGGRPARAIFAARRDDVGEEPFVVDLASLHGSAIAVEHGTGCAGNGRLPPRLFADRAPRLGDFAYRLEVDGAPPQAIGALRVSAWTRVATLPGGCVAYGILPLWIPAITDTGGRAAIRTPVPASPAFLGLELATQFLVVARPAGAVLGVADLSPGLRLVIGR